MFNKMKTFTMKKISIVLGITCMVLAFSSCSKDDCVCVTTQTENGVVTSTSSTSNSNSSGVPGPLGSAYDEDCDYGDSSSCSTSGNITYSNVTECELE